MGSKASKPAQAATRKFPTRAPGSAPRSVAPPPRTEAPAPARNEPAARAQAAYTKEEGLSTPSPLPVSWVPKGKKAFGNGACPLVLTLASPSFPIATRQDASDPDLQTDPTFAQRLRQMGVATPNPTLSNSSTAVPSSFSASPLRPQFPAPSANTTLGVLEARRQIQERFELQTQNPAVAREFLDVGVVKQVLGMRERGAEAADIEKRLRLQPGLVERVGARRVVSPMTL